MSNLNIKILGNNSSGVITLQDEIPAGSVELVGYSVICSSAPTVNQILINLTPLKTTLAGNDNFGFTNLNGLTLTLEGQITIKEGCNRTILIANSRIPNKFDYNLINGNTGAALNESSLVSIDLYFNIKNPNRFV